MDLSICIVNWCTGDFLKNCVESILNLSTKIQYEIILVDNHSSDNSFEIVKESYKENEKIIFLGQSENLGFAAGNNLALEHSRGRYVVLLNPDTVVHAGALDHAIAFLDDHLNCGILGPKLLNPDNTLQPSVRSFPSVKTALIQAFPFLKNVGFNDDINYEILQYVDQPSGACLFVRREAIEEVGGLDEQFFMYYEEVDWCFRIAKVGWEIIYNPKILITHFGGQSSIKNLDVRIVHNNKSKIRYFKKHFEGKYVYLSIIRLLTIINLLLRLLSLPLFLASRKHSWLQTKEAFFMYKRALKLTFVS